MKKFLMIGFFSIVMSPGISFAENNDFFVDSMLNKISEKMSENQRDLLRTEPNQKEIDDIDIKKFKFKDFIHPKKVYKIAARVLSKKNYENEEMSNVMKIDLLLGWSSMADTQLTSDMRFYQSNRFGYVEEINDINTNIDDSMMRQVVFDNYKKMWANTHIIPANDKINNFINKNIEKNDIIYLEGFLVDVSVGNGKIFRTSMSRSDSGAGACEILWVNKVINYTKSMESEVEIQKENKKNNTKGRVR